MREFYEFFGVFTDEEMARHLDMDVRDLTRHINAGRVPWIELIPALVEKGVTVEVIMGNMQLGLIRDAEKSRGKALRIRAKVDYVQMLELRKRKLI